MSGMVVAGVSKSANVVKRRSGCRACCPFPPGIELIKFCMIELASIAFAEGALSKGQQVVMHVATTQVEQYLRSPAICAILSRLLPFFPEITTCGTWTCPPTGASVMVRVSGLSLSIFHRLIVIIALILISW